MKDKKLIIVGDSSFAEIAYEYFTHDSPYEVVAFSVEKNFLKRENMFGLPMIAFEELEKTNDPKVIAGLSYGRTGVEDYTVKENKIFKG